MVDTWKSVLSAPGWGSVLLYDCPIMMHQLSVCSPNGSPGQRSRCQDLLGAHLSSEASAKAKCPLVACAKPASPLPRAGERAGGLMPAFISSSVSGNQTGVSLGRGPPHTSGPRHAWVMWGHHIREPLPAGSWQGNSGVIGVSRCPWYSG